MTPMSRSAVVDVAATAVGVLGGLAVDAVVGDPHRGHPVAAYGRAVAGLESWGGGTGAGPFARLDFTRRRRRNR